MARRGLSAEALRCVAQTVAPEARVVRYRPLGGGISASVHVVVLETHDGTRHDLVVRRFNARWHDAETSAREFDVLTELAQWNLPTPRPLLLDQTGGAFGAPTVVMSRLAGRPDLQPCDMDDYVRQIAATLVHLHEIPIDGLGFLPEQETLLTESLRRRRLVDDPLEPALRETVLTRWPPPAAGRALVHGDYWPGNLLWRRGRLTGVIDWEDASIGDPARDVAICRGDLTILFGLASADAFLARYQDQAGVELRDMPFWDLLTCTLALPEVEHWSPSWRALGRLDLTVESARERLRQLALAALARL